MKFLEVTENRFRSKTKIRPSLKYCCLIDPREIKTRLSQGNLDVLVFLTDGKYSQPYP